MAIRLPYKWRARMICARARAPPAGLRLFPLIRDAYSPRAPRNRESSLCVSLSHFRLLHYLPDRAPLYTRLYEYMKRSHTRAAFVGGIIVLASTLRDGQVVKVFFSRILEYGEKSIFHYCGFKACSSKPQSLILTHFVNIVKFFNQTEMRLSEKLILLTWK